MGGDYKGKRFSGPRTMFPATCNKCGAACSVPFMPSGKKPVYCSNCFKETESREGNFRPHDGGNRRYDGRSSRPDSRQSHSAGMEQQLTQLNTKLDQVIDLLSQMVPKKTD